MSTQPNPVVKVNHTAQSIADILAILNLSLQLTPHAVGLVKHFVARASTIPADQLDAYFAETSAKFDAIAAKAKAELGEAPPPLDAP